MMATQSSQIAAQPEDCDVLVIGGGPGGSTVAALLAERGHRVTLAEKAHHPRFHIGESLLPANLPLLERLGVADEIRALAMVKWGVQFISPWHENIHQSYEFKDAWDKSMPHAYQVRRSEFDHVLLQNAARKGAQVIEGCRVRDIDFAASETGAVVFADDGSPTGRSWRARYVIDASGRDTFMANRQKSKHRNPDHNSSSLYAHFRGAIRQPGQAEGDISIFWFDHGWLWFIPLVDGATSVGAVVWPYYMKSRSVGVEAFFLQMIAQAPELAARLATAEMVTPVEATGNFSYGSDHTYGPGYLLLGDAFAFIDPVFSSGVMLAMQSAFYAADAVDVCLRAPTQAKKALKAYDKAVRFGPRKFSWFIYRINHPSMRDLFMGPSNIFHVKEALLSVLAGDIFGTTPIWRSVAAFKLIYYMNVMRHPRRSVAAWRKRRISIQV
ncbi:MAG: NAD(P)/FAD-dependent oxidoreductase [Acidiferrobacter sp.]